MILMGILLDLTSKTSFNAESISVFSLIINNNNKYLQILKQTQYRYNNSETNLSILWFMDLLFFQEDSYSNEIHRCSSWIKDSDPISLIELDLSCSKDQLIKVFSFSSPSSQLPQSLSSIEITAFTSIPQSFQSKSNNQSTKQNKTTKSKNIYKQPKHDKQNNLANQNISQKRSHPKTPKNRAKSKYNNMAGFLIGTFSQILNKQKNFGLSRPESYESIPNNSIKIQQLFDNNLNQVDGTIFELKQKIFNLPRKEGSKKHLFQSINSYAYDTEQTKISKKIIRMELIQNLSRQEWLEDHVKSRNFKPDHDDHHGTKKLLRHQSYLKYLKAIRFALEMKDCIPKRLTL